MELIPVEDFEEWAGARELGWDPRYPGTETLTYLAAPGNWRRWDTPADLRQLAWFVEATLRTASVEAGPFLVLPRDCGRWFFGGERVPVSNEALDVIARGTGVPADFRGAVKFSPD